MSLIILCLLFDAARSLAAQWSFSQKPLCFWWSLGNLETSHGGDQSGSSTTPADLTTKYCTVSEYTVCENVMMWVEGLPPPWQEYYGGRCQCLKEGTEEACEATTGCFWDNRSVEKDQGYCASSEALPSTPSSVNLSSFALAEGYVKALGIFNQRFEKCSGETRDRCRTLCLAEGGTEEPCQIPGYTTSVPPATSPSPISTTAFPSSDAFFLPSPVPGQQSDFYSPAQEGQMCSFLSVHEGLRCVPSWRSDCRWLMSFVEIMEQPFQSYYSMSCICSQLSVSSCSLSPQCSWVPSPGGGFCQAAGEAPRGEIKLQEGAQLPASFWGEDRRRKQRASVCYSAEDESCACPLIRGEGWVDSCSEEKELEDVGEEENPLWFHFEGKALCKWKVGEGSSEGECRRSEFAECAGYVPYFSALEGAHRAYYAEHCECLRHEDQSKCEESGCFWALSSQDQKIKSARNHGFLKDHSNFRSSNYFSKVDDFEKVDADNYDFLSRTGGGVCLASTPLPTGRPQWNFQKFTPQTRAMGKVNSNRRMTCESSRKRSECECLFLLASSPWQQNACSASPSPLASAPSFSIPSLPESGEQELDEGASAEFAFLLSSSGESAASKGADLTKSKGEDSVSALSQATLGLGRPAPSGGSPSDEQLLFSYENRKMCQWIRADLGSKKGGECVGSQATECTAYLLYLDAFSEVARRYFESLCACAQHSSQLNCEFLSLGGCVWQPAKEGDTGGAGLCGTSEESPLSGEVTSHIDAALVTESMREMTKITSLRQQACASAGNAMRCHCMRIIKEFPWYSTSDCSTL